MRGREEGSSMCAMVCVVYFEDGNGKEGKQRAPTISSSLNRPLF